VNPDHKPTAAGKGEKAQEEKRDQTHDGAGSTARRPISPLSPRVEARPALRHRAAK